MRWKKMKAVAVCMAGAVFTLTAGCGAKKVPVDTAGTQDVAQDVAQEKEDAAGAGLFTNMSTTDLEGNAVDSSIFEDNKMTVVNVWNLGCTPCVQEIPVLDQIDKAYADKGVSVKGLYHNFSQDISDEDKAAIAELFEKSGAEYMQLVPSKEMYATDEMENMQAFPTTYFVDAKGNIIDKVEGSNDYEGWKNTVEEMLKKVEK